MKINKTELPKGWKIEKIGNLGKIVSGGTPPTKSSAFWNGNIPWISSSDLTEEHIDQINISRFISEEAIKKSSTNLIPKKSLLVVSRVGVGKIAISNVDLCTSQDFQNIIIEEDKTSIEYFAFQLKDKFIPYVLKVNQGSTIKGFCKSDLYNYKIPVPPIKKQKKIADILTCADSLIEKTQNLLAEKILQKEAIAKKLLSPKKHWGKIKLSDVLKTGSKTPVKDTSAHNKISIKLYKKGIQFFESKRIMADTRPFYIRKEGEIIIGKQNYFNGSIAILSKEFNETICSNAIMSFSTNKLANTVFVYEYISQTSYMKRREKLSNGTGQKELSEKEFLKFEIYIPNITEQNAIVDIINKADKEISLIEDKIKELKDLKKALMQKLLTGNIRVKA